MIITKEQITKSLNDDRPEFVERYIGRALVALFGRQMEDEKKVNVASHENTMGFSGPDAKSGSITAKYFIKHGKLLDWQIENWKKDFGGFPRLAKYHRQLSEIATERVNG